MAGSQLIHQTREGRAFHEAMYTREAYRANRIPVN